MNPFGKEKLNQIFKVSSRNESLIGTNEGITIEYKESFGWASLSDYLKAMASFANRDGGYIIFGVKDKPHVLKGLHGEALGRFSGIDNETWSTHIREHFSPEIIWEKNIIEFQEKQYGIIYTHSCKSKPVICKKSAGELRKAAIYYRYNSQNSEIDYPELAAIIEHEKEKIHLDWMSMVKQIGDNGISKTAILDLKSGKLTGTNTTLYMDESLINEISFVQEGSFVETGGDPALIVRGQVQTVVGAKQVIVERDRTRAINYDDIIRGFITLENVTYPVEYIKQICYQNTGNLPVYFYISKSNLSIEEVLTLLAEIPNNSQAKIKLINRLNGQIIPCLYNDSSTSKATLSRNEYRNNFIDQSIVIPTDESELKYCVSSIRTMSKEQISVGRDYILNLIYKIFTNFYYNPEYEKVKSEIRYTICYLDEMLYKAD